MGNVAQGSRPVCCGKVCSNIDGESPEFDDLRACDPAGAVFFETLEDLNEVDRLLLLFASSFNVAAVRWLLILGANPDACDVNGTDCLHAACRSGSVMVVKYLISHGVPPDATDVSGWTALHVAMFMGRRSVALHLMENGADLRVENGKGSTPIDICTDPWLREAAQSCLSHRHTGQPGKWRCAREDESRREAEIGSRLRFEPFFVPRPPLVKDSQRIVSFQQLGTEIFNQRPGQGLSFLVATGAVRDYPIELSSFLMESKIDSAQVGELLGEDFSLSQTLRLEFINSVRLKGTGVVSCLAKVFKLIQIPSDMRKIDRLVEGIAQIWWRQHERIYGKAPAQAPAQAPSAQSQSALKDGTLNEVEGLELMCCLTGHDMLYQLMFSSVLLHWSLYAPLPPSQRITLTQWLSLNSSLESPDENGGAGLQQTLCLIFNMISRYFVPQLQIWVGGDPGTKGSPGQVHSGSMASLRSKFSDGNGKDIPSPKEPKPEPVEEAVVEGWARLVGVGLPSLGGSSGTVTYRHIRNIHSETPSTAFALSSPATSRSTSRNDDTGPAPGSTPLPKGSVPASSRSAAGRLDPLFGGANDKAKASLTARGRPSGNGSDVVWCTLRSTLMLLSAKSSPWLPYGFIHMGRLEVQSSDPVTHCVTLNVSGEPLKGDSGHGGERGAHCDGNTSMENVPPPPVQLIFLLPDGRWQVVEQPCLKLQLSNADELKRWTDAFPAHCSPAANKRPPKNVAAATLATTSM